MKKIIFALLLVALVLCEEIDYKSNYLLADSLEKTAFRDFIN